MSTKYEANQLIDNSEGNTMLQCLQHFVKNPTCRTIRIATGYWDLLGFSLIYEDLAKFLAKRGNRLLLLLGKDPYIYARQLKDSRYSQANDFGDNYKIDLQNLEVTDELLPVVDLLLQNIGSDEESKIQIHKFSKDTTGDVHFLHSKCYIFSGEDGNKTFGKGIIGSSNFTQKGLEDNAELNYLEINPRLVLSTEDFGEDNKSHLQWFNEKWDNSEDWSQAFRLLLDQSPIGKERKRWKKKQLQLIESETLTPYEVYIRYVQEQIGNIVGEEVDLLHSYVPAHYEKYNFQLEAAQQCAYIMQRHNGFMLADVVGLGKTVVGMLVIKKFLQEESCRKGRSRRVLVITPPAIKRGWEDTAADFDVEATEQIAPLIDYVTIGSIGKMLDEDGMEDIYDEANGDDNAVLAPIDNQQSYGLIIIDESHNFRNRETQKYKDVNELIDRMTIQGLQPYVGLLSATPQNNAPEDLKNQIQFFVRNNVCHNFPDIEGGMWIRYFEQKMKEYASIKRSEACIEERTQRMEALSKDIREKVLNQIVVRRTRTDIQKHYADSGLVFPKIAGPSKLEYEMDAELADLFHRTVETMNLEGSPSGGNYLRFARYAAINYLVSEEHRKFYEKRNLKVSGISAYLATNTKFLLVKRLESSYAAFHASLENLLEYTNNMLQMLNHDTVFICPDFNVNECFKKVNGNFNEAVALIRSKMLKKGDNNREFRAADFKTNYRDELESDCRILRYLIREWNKYVIDDGDPKKEVFRDSIHKLFRHTTTTAEGTQEPSKLVIFTEAIPTLDIITKELKKKGYRVLKISAENRKEKQEIIRANFDANYKGTSANDYDVIVTTEVLAEGVNLHRANVILNYDIPWNSTRLMQRIGRVNRIGSTAKEVYVYNFYPSSTSEEVLKLIQYSQAKLQAFHTMFGEDSQIFSDQEVLSDAEFLHTIDGEESPILTHITNLKRFEERHPERYKFLCNLPMRNLGGTMDNVANDSVVVLGYENGGYDNMLNDQVTPISFDTMMNLLMCSENDTFAGTIAANDPRIVTAQNNCHEHTCKVLTSKDSDKKRTEALGLFTKLKAQLPSTTPETSEALDILNAALRSRNITVINYFLNNKERILTPTLFPEEDLQEWVTAAFSKVSEQATKKRGEQYVAIAILKK